MKIFKKTNSPRYIRQEGITSYLLASPLTSESKHMATTLVEIESGGKQRLHQHIPEQVYFIIEGKGIMMVNDESEIVGKDDCIFVPSNTIHGLENVGDEKLKYFSAASPSFTNQEITEFWPLGSEENEK